MSVKFVVDSTADLLPEVAGQVEMVYLSVRFGQREYTDRIELDSARFYEMLAQSDELPTTSQATPFAFSQVFDRVVAAGDQVVCITCSSKLSGTYQSAVMAALEHPGQVFVVDSQSVALGSSILVQYGLQLVAQGRSAEQIAEALTAARKRIRLIAMLDTLEYLKKGGRISKTVAFAGGLLNIKPVVCIEDGEIRMLGKARGSRQGNNLLVQEIEKAGGVDFGMPLLLGYTGTDPLLLHKYMDDSAELWKPYSGELPEASIGSVVGTHAGPGAVAVAFFSGKK